MSYPFSNLTSTEQSAKYINLSASGLVKTGPGSLQGLVINSQSSGTIKFWDNTSAATTVIFNTITFASTDRSLDFYGARFTTGCYVTIGGTADVTVIYN